MHPALSLAPALLPPLTWRLSFFVFSDRYWRSAGTTSLLRASTWSPLTCPVPRPAQLAARLILPLQTILLACRPVPPVRTPPHWLSPAHAHPLPCAPPCTHSRSHRHQRQPADHLCGRGRRLAGSRGRRRAGAARRGDRGAWAVLQSSQWWIHCVCCWISWLATESPFQ